MRTWLSAEKAVHVFGLLAAAFVAVLFFVPPEENLGWIIRLVYLHGALVQVGLVAFAAAGVAGVAALARPGPGTFSWSASLQRTAVVIWVAYALSSLWVTYEAWGQWVAWDEPRTRASVRILGLCLVFFALSAWVGRPRFAAFANVLMGVTTWILVKRAHLLRHPDDPIGESEVGSFKVFFGVLVLIALLAGIAFARWMHHREVLRPGGSGRTDSSDATRL